MPPTIPQCHADDDQDAMYAALDEAGCLVIHGMAQAETVATVRGELAEHVAAASAAQDDPDDFYPGLTHRVVALMHPGRGSDIPRTRC